MKFLSENEVEEYYGKPFEEVSPTDTPLDKFVCGNSTVECPECSETLTVKCIGVKQTHSNTSGFDEFAFCPDCELRISRRRAVVASQIDYQYAYHRTDEREEYVCSDCLERHPITEPAGEFEYTLTPTIISDGGQVYCPCGVSTSIAGVEFGQTVSCSNDDCSREFSFLVE